MKTLTIEVLYKLCQNQILSGNGKKKILLSDDDEGNGYHECYYHFTPIDNELMAYAYFPIEENEKDDYIILG